jgi:hypothetical protein
VTVRWPRTHSLEPSCARRASWPNASAQRPHKQAVRLLAVIGPLMDCSDHGHKALSLVRRANERMPASP